MIEVVLLIGHGFIPILKKTIQTALHQPEILTIQEIEEILNRQTEVVRKPKERRRQILEKTEEI